MLCGLAINGWAILPGYYGARSLSLGYASTGYNYDLNAMFINPALLANVEYTLTGYQYQNSYMDYKHFEENLENILNYDLKNFQSLQDNEKTSAMNTLKSIYGDKTGMYGFSSSFPGFVSKNVGVSVSWVNTGVMNPITTGTETIFNKDPQNVTNEDITALKMNFMGLKYKQITLAYALSMNTINFGIAVHYLNGKISEFEQSITESPFNSSTGTKDYLEYGWKQASKKFSRVVSDIGVSVQLGQYFTAGLVMKNFGNAKIQTPVREIKLDKRVTAGLSFRPNTQLGLYLDMDIKRSDFTYSGKEMQPISFGIEKGFFKNKLIIRGGMLNDLAEKQFLGKKSNVLYGLGLGFNMNWVIMDMGIGLNSRGDIKSLAISGFFLIK